MGAGERMGARLRLRDLAGRPGAGESGGGAPDGDLRHSGGPWAKAAGVAESLHIDMGTARARLTSAHETVAAAARGLASAATLTAVLASWEERAGAVRDECGALAPALRLVAKEQGEQDVRVKASFGGVHALSDGPMDGPANGRADGRAAR